jgi:tryptophan 7-halogenase
VVRLLALFPDLSFEPHLIDEYNRMSTREYERIRDFIILHYHATTRNDAPLWDHVRTMDLPETLQRKVDLFRSGGKFFRDDEELFVEPNWVAVMIGQGIVPESWDVVADTSDAEAIAARMERFKAAIAHAAAEMPTQQAFIDRFCKAPPLAA